MKVRAKMRLGELVPTAGVGGALLENWTSSEPWMSARRERTAHFETRTVGVANERADFVRGDDDGDDHQCE